MSNFILQDSSTLQNMQPQHIRIQSATLNYNKKREQEKLQNQDALNFNHDYNIPLIQQYGQTMVPGPSDYKPKYSSINNLRAPGSAFPKQKRLNQTEHQNYVTPSSVDYFNDKTAIKYDAKRAITFAQGKRTNLDTRLSNPGVGQYNTNKQYDMLKGRGCTITKANLLENYENRGSTPGVGQYRVKILHEKHTKQPHKFGTQSRFQSENKMSISNNPGVGKYNVQKSYKNISLLGGGNACNKGGVIPQQGKYEKRLSNSMSMTGPSPLDYNIKGHFDRLERHKVKDSVHQKKFSRRKPNLFC